MNKGGSIGIFDSGLGGLTVARQVMKVLPKENIVYFGDNGRVPYGERPREVIVEFSKQISRFLIKKGAKMIIIACNTATAAALDALKEEFDLPIIGVISAGARMAASATKNGKIGVIGTTYTIKSEAYHKKIKELRHDVEVYGSPCPKFTPLIEGGKQDSQELIEAAQEYLAPLKEKGVDVLVLGCTHYPIVAKHLQKIMGDSVTLVDPAIATAEEAKALLDEKGGRNEGNLSPTYLFYTTGDASTFANFAKQIVGLGEVDVTHVPVSELERG